MSHLYIIGEKVVITACPHNDEHTGMTGEITDISEDQSTVQVRLSDGLDCYPTAWKKAGRKRQLGPTNIATTPDLSQDDTKTRSRTVEFTVGPVDDHAVRLDLPGDLSLPEAHAIAAVFIHYITQWKEGK